jgi:hypothetical protein
MNLLGEQGDAGGNSQTPPDAAPAPTDLPEWGKGIELDLMNDPVMKNVRDIPSLVKGYVHAQRMVGRDKVVVPTDKSSAEEWKSFYNRVGLPEKLDSYNVDIKETNFSKEQLDKLKSVAFENNILPNQFQKMVEMFHVEQDHINKATSSVAEAEMIESVEALKKEWGDGFAKNISHARSVVSHFGGEETLKYLEESGLANNVNLVKFLSKVGASLNKEDTFNSDVTTRFGMTKDEASAEINRMYADPKHPMFDKSHASHNDALKKFLSMQEILAS